MGAPVSPLMQAAGKADEFKYPMVVALLAGLQRAGAPLGLMVGGLVLWLMLAVLTRIGSVSEWPTGLREWAFVLVPVLFNGFLIYAAVAYGVEVPPGS